MPCTLLLALLLLLPLSLTSTDRGLVIPLPVPVSELRPLATCRNVHQRAAEFLEPSAQHHADDMLAVQPCQKQAIKQPGHHPEAAHRYRVRGHCSLLPTRVSAVAAAYAAAAAG